MYLYYTGTSKEGDKQNIPAKSLGGYLSSDRIPNSSLNNIFSPLSIYSVQKNEKETIGIVLKNESGKIAKNMKIWFDYPVDCFSKIEIAIVGLSVDRNGYFMEKLPTSNSSPYSAVFYEANGELNALEIGDLAIDGMYGIWLKKSLLLDNINKYTSFDELYKLFSNKQQLPTQDNIKFIIDFENL